MMKEITHDSIRMSAMLLASWNRPVSQSVFNSLNQERIDKTEALTLRETIEPLLPKGWKFGKKWYSNSRGQIFVLKPITQRSMSHVSPEQKNWGKDRS